MIEDPDKTAVMQLPVVEEDTQDQNWPSTEQINREIARIAGSIPHTVQIVTKVIIDGSEVVFDASNSGPFHFYQLLPRMIDEQRAQIYRWLFNENNGGK